MFDENRYFIVGNAQRRCSIAAGVIFGVNICEDIWISGGAVEDQVVKGGAEVILNLSASPYHAGKAGHRRRMISTRASDHLASSGFVNLVGGQDEIVFDGGSMIVDPQGELVVEGRMFEEDLVIARPRPGRGLQRPAARHAPAQGAPAARGRAGRSPTVRLPAGRVDAAHAGTRPPLPPREPARVLEPIAEIYQALVTGTRDYVRKTGFGDVVMGLSGGIDSALIACIAVDALGAGHVTGVSMPSSYTSGESQRDAEALAKALGVRFAHGADPRRLRAR